MKANSKLSESFLSEDASSSKNGNPPTFIFPPAPENQQKRARQNRLFIAVVLVMGGAFVWACWNFVRAGQTYSTQSLFFMLGLLIICLMAAAAAVGAVFWSRHDIGESKRLAEVNARLVRERDLLHTIVDNLPDYIYAKDRQGRFVLNNTAHAGDLGAESPDEMKGKSDFDYHPRELAEQFFTDEQRIIATGQSVINQEQYKARRGDKSGKKRWSFTSKVVWRDRNGDVLGTVGITRDIHEFKQTQEALRQSEEKLRVFTAQLERSNHELQDFAYVTSHDLQEPLRKIVVFGDRLKEKCSDLLPEESRDYLERMQRAATRMQTLISDLLSFSRVTTKARPFAPVDLSEVAHEVASDLEARIEQAKGKVEIGSLPVIDAEKMQMRQLLQNLIGNALKFHKPGESPQVNVSSRKITSEAGRELCELTVSDNGIGFDEKYLDRIFHVFQRLHTREEYEGNGMGLAIVRKIALYHGGDVTAKSKPGFGAAFIVTLPTVQPKTNETHHEHTNHES